ncbi:hypothetical protein HDV01_005799 [Terramyces sp. JEL0728]|nr:hypothetical protein HDV01_005799 [Terramyces sp. JEL0728]
MSYCITKTDPIPTNISDCLKYTINENRYFLLVSEFRLTLVDFDITKKKTWENDSGEYERPYDVIVVTSDSGYLSFLVVDVQETTGSFRLIVQEKLSTDGTSYTELGHLLAVDPYHNNTAICAFESKICVYAPQTKSADISMRVEGVIWNMCFLYPSTKTGIVKFVVVHSPNGRQGDFLVSCYEFEVSNPKRLRKYVSCSISSDYCPLSLIALPNIPDSFLLTTPSSIILFEACPSKAKVSINLSSGLSFQSQYDSANGVDESQTLFFATDQGTILQTVVSKEYNQSKPSWNLKVSVIAKYQNSIGKMAILSNDGNAMILGLFGSQASGEVVMIKAKRQLITFWPSRTIENKSPVHDYYIEPNVWSDTMYIATGLYPNGIIKEIQSGLPCETTLLSDLFDQPRAMWGVNIYCMAILHYVLVLSYPGCTRVMYMDQSSLEDITDSCGIVHSQTTLNAFTLDYTSTLVQITNSAIVISKMRNSEDGSLMYVRAKSWKPVLGTIVSAASFGDKIVVACSNPSKLYLLRILVDQTNDSIAVIELSDVNYGKEISTICVPPFSDMYTRASFSEAVVLIGNYEGTIEIVRLESLKEQPEIIHSIKLQSLHSMGYFNIPHSISVISNQSRSFVTVGNRNGDLIYYTFSNVAGKLVVSDPRSKNIGSLPVQFIAIPTSNALIVYSNQRPIMLKISANKLNIVELAHEKIKVGTFISQVNSNTIEYQYLFITENVLSMIQVDHTKQEQCRRIFVEHTPKYIVYDKATKNLVIACEPINNESPWSVKVVEPNSGVCYHTFPLKPNEIVTCITIWRVKQDKRYICVGTKWANGNPQGRVLVFNVKYSRSSTSNLVQYKLHLPGKSAGGPITSLTDFGHYLMAGIGNALVQIKIQASDRTIVHGVQTSLNHPANSIKTFENEIYLASSQDSTCIYKFSSARKSIEFDAGEVVPRQVQDTIVFPQEDNQRNIVSLLTSGTIAGYIFYNTEMKQDGFPEFLDPIFHFNLQEPCSKICFGSTVSRLSSKVDISCWKSLDEMDFDVPWQVDSKAVVQLVSITGTRFGLVKLSERMFGILNLLQSILQKWESTKPILGGAHESFRSTEFGKPQHVIDGLFISQFKYLASVERTEIVLLFNSRMKVDGSLDDIFEQLSLGERELYGKAVVTADDIDNIINRLESVI